jgi:hypothetical protein
LQPTVEPQRDHAAQALLVWCPQRCAGLLIARPSPSRTGSFTLARAGTRFVFGDLIVLGGRLVTDESGFSGLSAERLRI